MRVVQKGIKMTKKQDTEEIPIITDEILEQHNAMRPRKLTNQRKPKMKNEGVSIKKDSNEKSSSNTSIIILGFIAALLVGAVIYMGFRLRDVESSNKQDLMAKVEQLTRENQALKSEDKTDTETLRKNKNLEEEVRKLEEEKIKQEEEIAELKANTTSEQAQANYDALVDKYNNLLAENQSLRSQLDSIDTSEKDYEISRLKSKVSQLEGEVTDKSIEIEQLRLMVDESQNE